MTPAATVRSWKGSLVSRDIIGADDLLFVRGNLSVYRVFRKPLLQEVPGQNGVWTPPRGLSTAIFGDSFEDLSKKRADVDMWTGVSLLIIERRGVHISWGALGGGRPM